MAEAFARRLGADARSAGSSPSGQVHPAAIEAMAEVGLDLGAHRSKSLAEVANVAFDAVVTMGCGDACPAAAAPIREDWPIPDPKELPPEQVRAVRDEIERRVRALMDRLTGPAA
jgi:protein-tyrosine-phosphatase